MKIQKCWTWYSPTLYKSKIVLAFVKKLESVPEPHQHNMPVVDMDWVKNIPSFKRLTLCYLRRVTCCHECHMVAEEAELGRPVVSVLADNSLWFPVVEHTSVLQASAHYPAHPFPPGLQPYMYEWTLFMLSKMLLSSQGSIRVKLTMHPTVDF